MDASTRQRIEDNASLASWRRVVASRPELVAAQAGPESVVEWLEACWPQARAGAAPLLRALSMQPWRIANVDHGDAAKAPMTVVIRAAQRAWAVRLHVATDIAASHVERLSESPARNET